MPLQIVRHDITKMRVDAIVNTTNEKMAGYSGVYLAVHSAAGPEPDKKCEHVAPLGLGIKTYPETKKICAMLRTEIAYIQP